MEAGYGCVYRVPGTGPRRQSRLMAQLLNTSGTAVQLLYLLYGTVESLPTSLTPSASQTCAIDELPALLWYCTAYCVLRTFSLDSKEDSR